MRRDKAPLKFPKNQAQAVDLEPMVLRVKGLLRRAGAEVKGDDPVFDAWIVQHLGMPNGNLGGIAGLPLATDAYMRGLHAGLKAHIPIEDTELFKVKRNEFAGHIARAMIRYGVVEAATKLITKPEGYEKTVEEMCNKVEAAFKRLDDLKGDPAPSEHPLVKAQRVMGEKIVDVRTAKNRPELSEADREEANRVFRQLQQLYLEMFGAMFPG